MGWIFDLIFGGEESEEKKAGDAIMEKHRKEQRERSRMSAAQARELDLIDRQHGYKGERGWFGGQPPHHEKDDDDTDTSFLGWF